MHGINESLPFHPVRIAVLVMSDTRTLETDTSGKVLTDRIEAAGHILADRKLLRDDKAAIRAQVSAWIANPEGDVVITSGGTGLTGFDVTPEAITPLFDKVIDGFSVIFHQVS